MESLKQIIINRDNQQEEDFIVDSVIGLLKNSGAGMFLSKSYIGSHPNLHLMSFSRMA